MYLFMFWAHSLHTRSMRKSRVSRRARGRVLVLGREYGLVRVRADLSGRLLLNRPVRRPPPKDVPARAVYGWGASGSCASMGELHCVGVFMCAENAVEEWEVVWEVS